MYGDNIKILAHTVTLRQRGTVPHRLVLVAKERGENIVDEYVVWYENFKEDCENKVHNGFHTGHYFPVRGGDETRAFQQAHAKFAEKAELFKNYVSEDNYIEIF